jgi:hypothetical protein
MGTQYFEGRSRSGQAASALGSYLRVVVNSSGKYALAGVAEAAHGYTTRDVFAADDPIAPSLANLEGTVEVKVSEAIALGGLCYAAASGKVASSGTILEGINVGGAATANNDIIEMLPIRSLGLKSNQTMVRALRTRVTTANVNAGATLLAAIPGYKYRLHDAAMIAIGGGAATATTVDILATQSASSVKLVANAVAGLTQNTLLRAGATNSTILAGGVSFVANDANTAITIGKTGSDLATATSIDVLLLYTIEE